MSSYEDLQYNPKHKKPLGSWMKDIKLREKCHGDLATFYDRRDKTCNTVSVALTGLSSSAMLASVSGSVENEIGMTAEIVSYAAGIIAVLSTVLQAVHKSMQYASLAEQHKNANKQLLKLRFRLEIIAGDNFEDDGEINFTNLNEWTNQYEDVLESSPMIPVHYFKQKEALYEAEQQSGRVDSTVKGVVTVDSEYGSTNSTTDFVRESDQEEQPLLTIREEDIEEARIDDQLSGLPKSDSLLDQEKIAELVRANENVGVEKLHKLLINEGFNIRKKRVRALKNEILGASPAPVSNPSGLMDGGIIIPTDTAESTSTSVSGDDPIEIFDAENMGS